MPEHSSLGKSEYRLKRLRSGFGTAQVPEIAASLAHRRLKACFTQIALGRPKSAKWRDLARIVAIPLIATGTSAAQWSVAKADGTGHLTDSRGIPSRAIRCTDGRSLFLHHPPKRLSHNLRSIHHSPFICQIHHISI